jgi:propanol-preferring alcohol dehydrogenase
MQLGAEYFVDFQKGDPVKEVVDLTGGGAHAVFVTAVQSYPISLDYLGVRAGGKVMWCVKSPPTSAWLVFDETSQN